VSHRFVTRNPSGKGYACGERARPLPERVCVDVAHVTVLLTASGNAESVRICYGTVRWTCR